MPENYYETRTEKDEFAAEALTNRTIIGGVAGKRVAVTKIQFLSNLANKFKLDDSAGNPMYPQTPELQVLTLDGLKGCKAAPGQGVTYSTSESDSGVDGSLYLEYHYE